LAIRNHVPLHASTLNSLPSIGIRQQYFVTIKTNEKVRTATATEATESARGMEQQAGLVREQERERERESESKLRRVKTTK